MDRNFFRRIEVCFPILDTKLKKRVIDEGLKACLQDNCQAWEMDGDGGWHQKTTRSAAPKSAQNLLLQSLAGKPAVSDDDD
jgi:polyphosphate kinase